MSHSSKAIIIGAGIAGIASAIRLATQGFAVSVYEKNSYAGGKLSYFEQKGYCFDGGPSLFTQPELLEELSDLAGEPIEDYFSYKSVPIACKYFYEDGTVINGYANAEKIARELHDKNSEDESVIKKYLTDAASLYNTTGNIFLNYSLQKINTLLKAPIAKALMGTKPSSIFSSFNAVNKKSFRNPRTIQLFNRYATYNGSNPYKAPGMLSVIPHLEYNEGVYYPKGGMVSIAKALYRLALKKGVQFYFDTPVQQIICPKKTVKGVMVNGENKYADVLVSNVDVYFTYKQLLHDDRRARKILKQERSSSAFIFYWGIGKSFPQLELHNIFFSNNYEEEFDYIFKHKKLYSDPTVYINITSKCEPGIQAPAGKENWFVMVNAPADTTLYTEEAVQLLRSIIIRKVNRLLQTDIAPLIEAEQVLTPNGIEISTSSYSGSLYGTSSNSRMAAFLRHPNFSNRLHNLYFAGGSVHPGGGIPLCLRSAKIISELIAADTKKRSAHAH